jgi:hypothetical protein
VFMCALCPATPHVMIILWVGREGRLHHVVSFVGCVKGLSQHATNNSRLVGAQRELELYLVLAPELSQVVLKGLSQRLAELSQVVFKGLSQRLAECQKTL